MASRNARTSKITLWGAGVAAAALIGLSAYAFLADDDSSSTASKGGGASASPTAPGSPAPTYAPPGEWTTPERWANLPKGGRTDHGKNTGFPHTTEGAVAMMATLNATSVQGSHSMVDEQTDLFDVYMAKSDRTEANKEKVKANAATTDAGLRRSMGIPTEGAMPPGAYVRTYVIGYKTIKTSADEVSVYLLSRVTSKASETGKESSSYTRNLLAAQWEDGDWKLSTTATLRGAEQAQGKEQPAIVAPGDAEFNGAGWTAIRAAS
ncbi:hypothetical protein M1P56_35580 (plasmid) [Streptomyces sp. HU2014]|uniref:hypothetical protein n=1 Tax=Streptomyces sp. HU2014 TaxID=2939414 RepID=UPI00200E77A3|nr:hypothetical protein [Streptomyces sp. HU2014]UQI49813.1 hypothetical protein M1P56_35580 [Streptomyces sp. HU2014]